MSLLLRPRIRPEHASMLTIVAALAVAGGIAEATGLDTGIKWPNDAVAGGKKICGILTEMSTDMEEISYVVPGIGINVNSESFLPEIADTATSLKLCLGRTVKRASVIAAVVRHFAVVGVRELQSVVPLALPVEEPRHALQHIVVHLAENP